MKANELRIGNKLHYKKLDIIKPELRDSDFTVTADDILYLEEYPDLDFVEPIPITEEWLLEFGFEKNNWTERGKLIYRGWQKGVFLLEVREEKYYIDGTDFKSIQYIHQLQNIYFDLIGEELISKNPLLL